MASLTPTPRFQFIYSDGDPLFLGKLYTYAAGTDTPLATYTTSVGNVENTNPVILDAYGSASVWLGTSLYKMVLKDENGSTIYTQDNVGGGATLSDLSGTGSGQGAALIGFIQSGAGAVARTVLSKERDFFNVRDFGAVGDGVTDDTAAILAANAAMFAAGGGTLYFPEGSYGVSSLAVSWGTSSATVMWKGDGERVTVIRKIGVTTTPVIDWSATVGSSDGTYSYMEDFSVVGSAKSSHGIRLTGIARHKMRGVHVSTCDIGLELVGSLINTFYDCDLNSNNIGVRTRKSGSLYCNLNAFFGGGIRSNTTFGLDIGDANGFFVYGTDIENNGTALDTSTGQLIIRSTVDDEIGFSSIRFSGCWFEAGNGTNIKVEAASGLILAFTDVPLLASEAGLVMDVAAIRAIVLERVVAGTPGDTITLAASRSTITDSVINVLTDTSTSRNYNGVTTNAGTTQVQLSGAIGSITQADNRINSGTGSVATTSGVAATLFTTSLVTASMYIVYAYIDSSGSATLVANAMISVDRGATVRMGGDNGANLTITVSGDNVQVTQTSGAGQTVQYRYLRVG